MSSIAPLIYAELLSNIRQISVIVALHAPCDSATKVELSANGQQFLLQHKEQTTTLDLPGQAVSAFELQKPILGNKELSWRLPLAGQASRASIEDAQSNEVPWSAKDLSSDTEFSCRRCRAIIVERGTIRVWKDLPSENWAEMMDFWHCHKPDVPASEGQANGSSCHVSHDAEKVAASKGYGASTKFVASPGIALIDASNFVLCSTDCKNVMVSPFLPACPKVFDWLSSVHGCHGYQEGGHASLCDPVAWPAIQIPKIDTPFHSALARRSYLPTRFFGSGVTR
ncbi:hypothetical protein JHW43_000674 [Diplocarpon mali]|nr:hypothetical protein JHW43_000674 [Diplocarpon mali]